MAKILQFEKSDKIILEEIKRDAIRELQQLYKYTVGFSYPVPPILSEDLFKAFYEGTLEF